MLTDEHVERTFEAVPRVWRRLHDELVAHNPGHQYQSGTLREKLERLKGNIEILRKWLQRQ
jgi:hypothetical protein